MQQLLSIPYGKGSCAGCHVPYTVVVILQLDADSNVLSAEVRRSAIEWLKSLSHVLETSQLSLGGWDENWAGGKPPFVWGDNVMDRITVTGHHLEWMALAPPEVLPSRETISRAIHALKTDVVELTRIPGRSFKVILPASHAARALALMKGVDVCTAFDEAWRKGEIQISRLNQL